MVITRGNDGRFCATQLGAMGRVVVADGASRNEAMRLCHEELAHQMNEMYWHQESMTHLSLVRDGEYNETIA